MLVDGGGGGTSFDVDRDAAARCLDGLSSAAETLGKHGASVPTSVDAGEAEGVLSDIVFLLAQASGKLADEAVLMSDIGREMLVNYGDVDAAVAEVMARQAAATSGGGQ